MKISFMDKFIVQMQTEEKRQASEKRFQERQEKFREKEKSKCEEQDCHR